MKLLIQPNDGSAPLLEAINNATKSIDLVIFRFDRRDIEAALKAAAARGVMVRALVTYRNRGGEKNLRKLEMRLLEAGVTVARTADDLARYHDKLMIIDSRELVLLTFNYTSLDIDRSRSFGIITEDSQLVQEAARLFEADATRRPYSPQLNTFVVSPLNARKELAHFIEGARRQLLIYDPRIADSPMIGLLKNRAKAAVDVKIIGRTSKRGSDLEVRKLPKMRLHTRVIIRDREQAFLGSQSLHNAELDERREVGAIVADPEVVNPLLATFEADWSSTDPAFDECATASNDKGARPKLVKKAVKTLLKEMPPLPPIVKEAVKDAVAEVGDSAVDPKEVEETVKEAVKEAVKEGVKEAVKEAVKNEE